MAEPRRYKTGFTKLRSALSLMAQATTPEVVVSITNLSADKLRWLRLGGRDFEATTGELLREMGTAYVRGLSDLARGRTRDARRPWQLAGEVFKDRVASRLATSGGDVRSDPGAMQVQNSPWLLSAERLVIVTTTSGVVACAMSESADRSLVKPVL